MDAFALREDVIKTYEGYVSGFINIADTKIRDAVDESLQSGRLWPDPWIQINPTYAVTHTVQDLVNDGTLHPGVATSFSTEDDGTVRPWSFYAHQVDAIRRARAGRSYVMTTGTGSGKSLTYIAPIIDHVLRSGPKKGIRAIVVYPMNALANSQLKALDEFLPGGNLNDAIGKDGLPDLSKVTSQVTFARYTGQEDINTRRAIIENPPDILLTNYVMLEMLLTRVYDRTLLGNADKLKYVVLDELHTYRGRQGADVALLLRRVAEATGAKDVLHVGTSATMASDGTPEQQRHAVASVASTLFGTNVSPDDVIGETLVRVTDPDADDSDALRSAVSEERTAPTTFAGLKADPVAAWIEGRIGVGPDDEGVLRRCVPAQLPTLAADLAELTGQPEDVCAAVIEQTIVAGDAVKNDEGRAAFPFRLHQFVSRGSSVFASLELPAARDVTLEEQKYVPDGTRTRLLFPLAFCRECGQDYYPVERVVDTTGRTVYHPRDVGDRIGRGDGELGFLYVSSANAWPRAAGRDRYHDSDVLNRVPTDWAEEKDDGTRKVEQSRNKYLPEPVAVDGLGVAGVGVEAAFVPTPFKFCLNCGVSYGPYVKSDLAKLGSLGISGRSTATTMLTLSALLHLRQLGDAEVPAKLLNFTDNRQDASLQAGHFNDFIQVGLIRGALRKALLEAGPDGLASADLEKQVFEAIEMEPADYSQAPDAPSTFGPGKRARAAMLTTLRHRLFADLRGGYRVTSPNLENVGLLRVDYDGLDGAAAHEPVWEARANLERSLLTHASPDERLLAARTFLDYLRRVLAVNAHVLDPDTHGSIVEDSTNLLVDPWVVEDRKELVGWNFAVARPRFKGERGKPADEQGWRYATASSAFGKWIARHVFDGQGTVRGAELEQTVAHLVVVLLDTQFLARAGVASDGADLLQVNASNIVWKPGSGVPERDLLRVPFAPTDADDDARSSTNRFFREFYEFVAANLKGMEAREHTAQVQSDEREERENRFRDGDLDALFCSPTMELGIDIANLNVVGMRNVPPTPANYAQRSGRAGRSGQAAFVFTYCSTGSPHDQFYFRRPVQMVAGAVSAPHLDLLNEDLVRSHVQAIWLAETGADLGRSMAEDVLDIGVTHGQEPTFVLKSDVDAKLTTETARKRARDVAHRVLARVEGLTDATWWRDDPNWTDHVIANAYDEFWRATDRWRELYRAASVQSDQQYDASRTPGAKDYERRQAQAAVRDAQAQIALLSSTQQSFASDFYTYRYFASEGFLPGYSFPRLPLSAYIPGRRGNRDDREMLNRPRFLAVSEFGPQTFIYHNGARYQVTRVMLPIDADTVRDDGKSALTQTGFMCRRCGHLHRLHDRTEQPPPLCLNCNHTLDDAHRWSNLFRMTSVTTRRVEQISSNEEERSRLGYELQTGFTFATRGSGPLADRAACRTAAGEDLLLLTYAHTATLTRLNLGWSRRANRDVHGFHLDVTNGRWAKAPEQETDDETGAAKASDDPTAASNDLLMVVPYVEDRRNTLIVRPTAALLPDEASAATPEAVERRASWLASFESAFATAVRQEYQLEDSELQTVALPTRHAEDRDAFLLYEAAEGGAGVLRLLVSDPHAVAKCAREALLRTHYEPDPSEPDGWRDNGRAEGRADDCEAACYDCLMSYGNQPDHPLLDRKNAGDGQGLKASLIALLGSTTVPNAPAGDDERQDAGRRAAKAAALRSQAQSSQETRFVDLLEAQGRHLPDAGQRMLDGVPATCDFLYVPDQGQRVVVFIDGHPHCDPAQRHHDTEVTETAQDKGYRVIRLPACPTHRADESSDDAWTAVLDANPHVFGPSL